MTRERSLLALATLALAAAGVLLPSCANLLGYDDLKARPDAGPETSVSDGPDPEVKIDAGPVGVHPPPRPEGERAPSGTGKVLWFLVKRFYLGSVNHAGAKVGGAWREWGIDLDHTCTGERESKENIGTCRHSGRARHAW